MSRPTNKVAPDSRSRPPLVLMHGLMGSSITNKAGITSFVSIKAALNWRWRSLKLPTAWPKRDDGRWAQQHDGSTVSAEPILDVKVCGCISAQNYMGEADDFFLNVEPRRLSYFTFDWRRDCWETTERLEAHLRKVKEEHGEPPQIIVHSMGCNFVLAALHRCPDLIHSTILCGGTFGGCIGFYHLVQRGMPVGLNTKLVDPQTVATWACVFQVASPPGDPLLDAGDGKRHMELVDAKVLKEQQELRPIPVDWYDVADWERLKLGPWMGGATVSAEMRAHVVAALENGKAFQKLLREGTRPAGDYPPVAVLLGDGYERRNHYLWDTEKGMLIESHGKHAAALAKSHPFTETVETDGTVPTFSAIPHSVPHTVHVARHNGPDRGGGHHINLVDECEQLHEILEELEVEAKAKANGGRFTASALARASKRRFVMSRRMTFFAADRAMMGGV